MRTDHREVSDHVSTLNDLKNHCRADELMDCMWVCWNRWVSWTVIKELEGAASSFLQPSPPRPSHLRRVQGRKFDPAMVSYLPAVFLLYIPSAEDTPVPVAHSPLQPSLLLSPLTSPSRREAFWKSRHPSKRSADIIFRVTGRKDGGEKNKKCPKHRETKQQAEGITGDVSK